MPTSRSRKSVFLAAFAAVAASGPAAAFFDGQTGVIEKQLKSACPAFSAGDMRLVDSSSPPGNMPMTDIFEHESGARCACHRSRMDRTLRCGPTAPARNAQRPG